jgi:hypothetical protein
VIVRVRDHDGPPDDPRHDRRTHDLLGDPGS